MTEVETNNKFAGGSPFKRGLSPEFVDELGKLAANSSWFQDVLKDEKLIIAIRNEYINVYIDGQSLFKIGWMPQKKKINISTHPKYLFDPALSKQVPFDGTNFDIGSIEPMLTSYEAGKSLKRMKKAAQIYSGVEKQGVHRVVHANTDIVDLEIALTKSADVEEAEEGVDPHGDNALKKGPTAKRVDLARFEEIADKIHLCFWEAKHYSNAELWASGETLPPVVQQVSGYKKLIEQYKDDIASSYRTIAKNLVSLAKMAGRRDDQIGNLIKRVADDEPFLIETQVGVVVFGFSAEEKSGPRHKAMLKKLESANLPFDAKGKPADINLKWHT